LAGGTEAGFSKKAIKSHEQGKKSNDKDSTKRPCSGGHEQLVGGGQGITRGGVVLAAAASIG
jgi:hypothetical protein